MTPAGYLFCDGVPISSVRPALYSAREVPEIAPVNGVVTMLRDADVLFSQETIDSFQGMDVTIQHPGEMLGPDTWRNASVGTVLNPRRGEGAESDFLLADLLIKDAAAIDLVLDGSPQVSCGYNAMREEVEPGVGRFTSMIGNHVAIVPDGRYGAKCAIGDNVMSKRTVFDRLRTAFAAKDQAAFDEEIEAAKVASEKDADPAVPGVTVHVHNAPADGDKDKDANLDDDESAGITAALEAITKRLDALEAAAKKDDDADKEESDKGDDADAVVDHAGYRTLVSQAEILVPGLKIGDAQPVGGNYAASALKLKIAALTAGAKVAKGPVSRVTNDAAFDAVGAVQIDAVFRGAVEIARLENSRPSALSPNNFFPTGPMTANKYQAIIEGSRKKSI